MSTIIKPKRVGIYLRTSTAEQNSDMQRRELELYAEQRGWIVFKLYEDKASGTTTNRKMLSELMFDCKTRKIDVLLCWKCDRLFRSLKNMVLTLSELESMGVEFVAAKDPIDLSSSNGRLMAHLISAFAEFEADLIKTRVRSGLQAAKARGVRLGRPSLPLSIIAEVKRLRSEGKSIRGIAKVLAIGKTSVERALGAKR